MGSIQRNTAIGTKKQAREDVKAAKADAALGQIDDALAVLDGSPTNAQVVAALKLALRIQRRVIVYLKNQD